MLQRLFNFHGGIQLKRLYKKQSTETPVQKARIPRQIILPLHQHIGEPAELIVSVGDKISRGQVVARANGELSVPIHASTSGVVSFIGDHVIAHPSGLAAPCIIIDTDGEDYDRRQQPRRFDFNQKSSEELRELIHNCGIVGLGGAGFPSHIKLKPRDGVKTLIINGAECEPYITCDDMLMRERTAPLIRGTQIMRRALQAQRCVIAVENNKPTAYKAIKDALLAAGADDIELIKVPTVYPAGGEKQLIKTITNDEVPSQGHAIDIGIVCHNVGTAYAVAQAVDYGEPLISRLITVSGAVAHSQVLEVINGTPICDLIAQCGGNLKTLDRVIIGGPMMGFALHDVNAPVVKTTNCIIVTARIADVPLPSRNPRSLPCIRCGACNEACPIDLLPQQLYWHTRSKEFDKVQDYHLFDCIECGCCDYVCPSHIPLVQYYRYAKAEIWKQDKEKQLSDVSRERFEFRNFRLEREKRERAERHKQKRQAIKGESEQDKKKAIIEAAMKRVQAKQQTATPKNTNNLTAEQQRLIDEVDQRRTGGKKPYNTKNNNDDTAT